MEYPERLVASLDAAFKKKPFSAETVLDAAKAALVTEIVDPNWAELKNNPFVNDTFIWAGFRRMITSVADGDITMVAPYVNQTCKVSRAFFDNNKNGITDIRLVPRASENLALQGLKLIEQNKALTIENKDLTTQNKGLKEDIVFADKRITELLERIATINRNYDARTAEYNNLNSALNGYVKALADVNHVNVQKVNEIEGLHNSIKVNMEQNTALKNQSDMRAARIQELITVVDDLKQKISDMTARDSKINRQINIFQDKDHYWIPADQFGQAKRLVKEDRSLGWIDASTTIKSTVWLDRFPSDRLLSVAEADLLLNVYPVKL